MKTFTLINNNDDAIYQSTPFVSIDAKSMGEALNVAEKHHSVFLGQNVLIGEGDWFEVANGSVKRFIAVW